MSTELMSMMSWSYYNASLRNARGTVTRTATNGANAVTGAATAAIYAATSPAAQEKMITGINGLLDGTAGLTKIVTDVGIDRAAAVGKIAADGAAGALRDAGKNFAEEALRGTATAIRSQLPQASSLPKTNGQAKKEHEKKKAKQQPVQRPETVVVIDNNKHEENKAEHVPELETPVEQPENSVVQPNIYNTVLTLPTLAFFAQCMIIGASAEERAAEETARKQAMFEDALRFVNEQCAPASLDVMPMSPAVVETQPEPAAVEAPNSPASAVETQPESAAVEKPNISASTNGTTSVAPAKKKVKKGWFSRN